MVGGKVPLPLSSAAADSFELKLNSWSILGGGTKMLARAILTDRDQNVPMRLVSDDRDCIYQI